MAQARACKVEEVALEVESKLVAHYLMTTGPSGATPLTHIDASRPEIAECLSVADAELAISRVRDACGTDVDISEFLATGAYPNGMPPELPGFFRYLLLTCIVVASADENQESQEFGRNLQQLLNTRRTFGNRQALPHMWRQLASWAEQRRRMGFAIRPVILPSIDPRVPYLGLTNAISFPSWRDTHQLRSLFEKSHERSQVGSPREAALRVCPVIKADGRFSAQMLTASTEFEALHRRRASLLATHRFWSAVCRALELKRPRLASTTRGLRAELVLGAIPEDSRVIFLWERSAAPDGGDAAVISDCIAVDALSTLEKLAHEDVHLDGDLLHALREGALPFIQERFGAWISSFSGGSDGDQWLYLVRQDRAEVVRRFAFVKCKPLNEDWSLIEPVTASAAFQIHRALGLHGGRAATQEPIFHLRGGVRTVAGYLGRPVLLPWIEMDGAAEVSLSSGGGSRKIAITRSEGRALLDSDTKLDGQYQFCLEDHLNGRRVLAIERSIRFTGDAPEHPILHRPGARWRDRLECCDEAWVEFPIEASRELLTGRWGDLKRQARFDDLLELIYARGQSGWAERDLVDAIKVVAPGPSPWDVIRTLQESGWLEAKANVRWRANLWCLVAPNLRRVRVDGNEAAVLFGSTSAAVRARFEATTTAMGGSAHFVHGVGAYSPLTPVANGLPVDLLAQELGWPIREYRTAAPLRAPRWQSSAPAGIEKHEFHAEWSWLEGKFRSFDLNAPAEAVEVRWWRRAEADRADLFSVDGGATTQFVSPSRAVALAEAFRRARRPMLQECGAMLYRLPSDGYLPLHLAQTMHAHALASPGVVHEANGWKYAYPASKGGLTAVRACLGRHFVLNVASLGKRIDPQSSSHVGFSRHRGGRSIRSVAP